MTQSINVRGGLTSDPIRNFRFIVEFYPLTVGTGQTPGWSPSAKVGFTSVSGLSVSTESIPYREGGFNTTIHQVPGQSTFSPVTFQRGVTIGSSQHWNWMRMLFQTVGGNAEGDVYSGKQSFRSDIVISVLNHPVPYSRGGVGTGNSAYGGGSTETSAALDDQVVARFRLYNCWPTSVAYSDLNAGDNALMVEQMTIVHEGMAMKWATDNNDGTITSAGSFN